MTVLRTLLSLLLLLLALYLAATLQTGGGEFWLTWSNEIKNLSWVGLHNLDFLSYLLLIALWITWRHSFSPMGIALAVASLMGGFFFLAPYLLWESYKTGGQIPKLLTGPRQ